MVAHPASQKSQLQNWRIDWGRVGFYTILALALLIVLFPFYWMLISSSKTVIEISDRVPTFWPNQLNLEAYRILFFEQDFGNNLRISFLVSTTTSVLAVILATLGAYAVARLHFRGKGLMLNTILIVYLFPGVLLIIPLFAMLSNAGAALGFDVQDNLAVLVLTYLAQTLPVALYMLSSYFRTVPEEIEEAARIDGCGRLGVIWRVTLPLSVPAMATVGMYTFMIAWNEFLYAFIFLNDRDLFTLPIKLLAISQQLNTRWDVVMAASAVMTIPIIALFLIFERFLEQGLVAGGVKG
ncbi:MAG: ABC transporter permease [Chloroflexi bacterium RBG_16_57_9]|nr:MAG: ABC transporter permease [Chloroflexi bacterium RBG_16_57_9]